MEQREIVIENPRGLHMRVAAEIVRLTRDNGVNVRLSRDKKQTASGDSIIDLLMLDGAPGVAVRLEVIGPGEKDIARQISDLFSDGAGI